MKRVKDIPGFPDYAITKGGQVWSKPRRDSTGYNRSGRWLKPALDKYGYLYVILYLDGKRFTRKIHRLVLETYVGLCPKGMECRHFNGNRADPRLGNLKWGTKSENSQDAIRHGTHGGFQNRGENNGEAKLVEEQVQVIFYAYHDGTHTQQELADHFGVSRRHVGFIVNKKKWAHLWTPVESE